MMGYLDIMARPSSVLPSFGVLGCIWAGWYTYWNIV